MCKILENKLEKGFHFLFGCFGWIQRKLMKIIFDQISYLENTSAFGMWKYLLNNKQLDFKTFIEDDSIGNFILQ